MEFGSVVFLLRFLPIFLISYYLVPGRMKNVILLLGSLCFFSWGKPICLLPLIISACSSFIHGLLIEKHLGKPNMRIFLVSAWCFDLALLFVFGYAEFFFETANIFFGMNWVGSGFPVPLGITIYTLQGLSYVSDVSKGKCKARKNFFQYLTYLTMFPQLAAGPILRFRDVQTELRERKTDLHQISVGFQRICIGLAKKILIADTAGRLWMTIVGLRPENMSMATAWLGILAYAFQVYFMFSGLSDVAIGLGACLGFSFPENYDHPYAACSVTDFTDRWNKSLMRWMKEYVYRPLAGERKGKLLKIFFMLITWALIGLWYGPDWTFVLWGLWIGILFILESLFLGKLLSALPKLLGWCYTMLAISVGWVLLAMNDLSDVWSYFQVMFGAKGTGLLDHEFFFLGLENLLTLILGGFFALPIFRKMLGRLDAGRSGMAIAMKRLLEKIYPGVFLLTSLVYLIGRGW